MLSTADGRVRWEDPALTVDRRIRGVTPAPGAHTSYLGARFRLGPVTPVPEVTDLLPGQVRASKREVLVGTGGCAVRLGRVAARRTQLDARRAGPVEPARKWAPLLGAPAPETGDNERLS